MLDAKWKHCILLICLTAMLLVGASAETTFYVATNGNDDWSGTLAAPNADRSDGPLASLERARDVVRGALKEAQGDEDVRVFVRGGLYVLDRTLVFEPADSGGEEHPVVYEAYPGERPQISGGRAVMDWKNVEGDIWEARVEEGWYPTRLFADGKRLQRAISPNTDNWSQWYKVEKGGEPAPDAPEGMGSHEFFYPEGTITQFDNPNDIEINSLPSFRYANFISSVEKVYPEERKIRLKSMAYYNFRPGDPFRIENARSAIDQPGEWCVNSEKGIITLKAPEGLDPNQAEMVAPVLDKLIRFQGDEEGPVLVHDIVLRGFTFLHSNRCKWHEMAKATEAQLHHMGSALYFEATKRCAVEDCYFKDLAAFAARFAWTAYEDRFVGNEVVGAGCGGLQAGGYGPGAKDVNKGHTVTYNYIHHSSTDFWHAGAIDFRQAGESLIAYNLVGHMPYTAITISGAHTSYFNQFKGRAGTGRAKYNFRWDEIPDDNPLTPKSVKPFLHGRNNMVAHNVVHDVCWLLPADGGALYGFGQGLGNAFVNNLVYRSHCLGVYLDAEFDGVLVQNNIVYDSANPYGGSGAYPTMVGNEFYASGEAPRVVRLAGKQMTAALKQAVGPAWRRTAEVDIEKQKNRDLATRTFESDFSGMRFDALVAQSDWLMFGNGALVGIQQGAASNGYDPGMVAVGEGVQSWAAIEHDVVLDNSQEIVLQMDARLPDPLSDGAFFELYLNAGMVHSDTAFGIGLVGGLEDTAPDSVGVRLDNAGPRALAKETLKPGHWYRLRLEIPAGKEEGRLLMKDLTAGEKEYKAVTFPNGEKTTDLTAGDGWQPELASLDTLVLRLAQGAQACNIKLLNPPKE